LCISQIDIAGVVVAFETEMDIAGVNVAFETGLSVTDLLAAKFRPKPIAPASPAAAITPISVRILKVSSTVLEMDYSTFALKKGSTPDLLQLLRDQDRAQYLIIILMEIIKDLYNAGRAGPPVLDSGPQLEEGKRL
jgi:hypothetical protein